MLRVIEPFHTPGYIQAAGVSRPAGMPLYQGSVGCICLYNVGYTDGWEGRRR